jgi:hypothetical protein
MNTAFRINIPNGAFANVCYTVDASGSAAIVCSRCARAVAFTVRAGNFGAWCWSCDGTVSPESRPAKVEKRGFEFL